MRILQTNWQRNILLQTEHERIVHAWHLESRKRIWTMETTFTTSAAINDDASELYVTSRAYYGIAAYRCCDGQELWRRKDLGDRSVKCSRNPKILYSFNPTSCEPLNRLTGKSKSLLRGVHELWESPYQAIRLFEKKSGYQVVRDEDQTVVAKMPRLSFATLDVCFTPSTVLISESREAVRCFDTQCGRQLWRHDPPSDSHYILLAFAPALEKFFGLQWNPRRGGDYELFSFDPVSGRPAHISSVVGDDAVFCLDGTAIVTREGRMISVEDGMKMGRLDFTS
ncbi:MAG: hypothetical protein IAF94_16590 [Pirellulaceae bacterium]|nr:hypothetical protein [Pirellulaceae bacterium]